MRVLVILCITAAAMWLAVDAEGQKHTKELVKLSYDINHLTAGIVNVHDTLQRRKADKESAAGESRGMLGVLDKLEGTHCHRGEMSCQNSAYSQCVSNKLCCDGVKDCRNGADEADSLCNLDKVAKVGDIWSGHFEMYECTGEKLTDVSFQLNKFEIGEIPAFAHVEGQVYWTDVSNPNIFMDEQMPYAGIYTFGSRTADFMVNYHGTEYHEHMYFREGETNTLHYYIYNASDMELCGKAHMKLEE